LNNLARIRLSKNKTQEDMARELKIGVSTYNQYENSQRNVPDKIASKIAEILGVNIEQIFLPTKFTISKPNKNDL